MLHKKLIIKTGNLFILEKSLKQTADNFNEPYNIMNPVLPK